MNIPKPEYEIKDLHRETGLLKDFASGTTPIKPERTSRLGFNKPVPPPINLRKTQPKRRSSRIARQIFAEKQKAKGGKRKRRRKTRRKSRKRVTSGLD